MVKSVATPEPKEALGLGGPGLGVGGSSAADGRRVSLFPPPFPVNKLGVADAAREMPFLDSMGAGGIPGLPFAPVGVGRLALPLLTM